MRFCYVTKTHLYIGDSREPLLRQILSSLSLFHCSLFTSLFFVHMMREPTLGSCRVYTNHTIFLGRTIAPAGVETPLCTSKAVLLMPVYSSLHNQALERHSRARREPTPTGASTRRVASATCSAAGYNIRIVFLTICGANQSSKKKMKQSGRAAAAARLVKGPSLGSRCPYSIYCNRRDWKKGAEMASLV